MTTQDKSNSDATAGTAPKGKSEPSLGPACLVVSILALAAFSALCGFGSWAVFSNQYPLAVKSINKQLIPWVESSQLAPDDKQSIVSQLQTLVGQLESQSIDRKQLGRLRNCLQDNPILLWGGIQSIESQAASAGLTETEIATLRRINQRLMHMTTLRKLGRTDLEFTIQELSEVHQDGTVLLVRSNLSDDLIRSFMKRADNLLSHSEVPNEPYEKSPAEAFAILLEAALKPAEEQK